MKFNSFILDQEEIEEVYRLRELAQTVCDKMSLNYDLSMNFKLELFKDSFELLEYDLLHK